VMSLSLSLSLSPSLSLSLCKATLSLSIHRARRWGQGRARPRWPVARWGGTSTPRWYPSPWLMEILHPTPYTLLPTPSALHPACGQVGGYVYTALASPHPESPNTNSKLSALDPSP
jgi:hypothetical protein